MIADILALGLSRVECGYDLTVELVPGVRRMVDSGAITVTSVHNFCPVPVGVARGHPELFHLASPLDRARASAVRHTRATIDFAASVRAPVIVAHAGYVETRQTTRSLIDLCLRGEQYGESFDKAKMKLIMQRDQRAARHLEPLFRSLDELLPDLSRTGTRLALEILPSWEGIPSETEMEQMMARFPAAHVGYWHDLGHAQTREYLGFISHRRWLDRLLPALAGVHVHDIAPPANDHLMPPLGRLDFARYRDLARASVPLVLEPAPATPEDQIRTAVQVLSEQWDLPAPAAASRSDAR